MCNRHHIEQYTENMIHFISDVRKELDAPTMPFIVGILGVYGTGGVLVQRVYIPHLGGPTCRSHHPIGL
jgi:hypothetical protein